jgi:hypothetical protein
MTSLRAKLLLPSPPAAAAGVLNLTNYTLARLSGILLLCPQTEILYKITFSLRLHSDPEREGGRERERDIILKALKPEKRDRMLNYGQGNLKYIMFEIPSGSTQW